MAAGAPASRSIVLDQPATVGESDHALELLSDTAVAVGNGLDVDALLGDIAAGVRRALDADRVSVLLLDNAGRLTPAIAVARQQDESLWQRFRQMPPISLADIDGAQEALTRGRALVIDDASVSPLVPGAWQQAFHLGSLAMAPVSVGDAPAGILVVELPTTAAPVPVSRISLLEGMAALAGVALSGLRRNEAAARAERLSAAVDAITAARSARGIAEYTVDALLDVCGLTHGLFALLTSADSAEVAAVRGGGLPEPGRYSLAALPPDALDVCRAAWRDGLRQPVEVVADGRRVTVVPVPTHGRVVAVAVLPTEVAALSTVALTEVHALADVAGLALRTAHLLAEREWRRRAADIDAALSAGPSAAAVADLLRAFLSEAGLQMSQVVVDRATARCTGLPVAAGPHARLLTKWRRETASAEPTRIGPEVVVPLLVDGRVVGAMFVQPALLDEDRIAVSARLLGFAIAGDIARHTAAELERLTAETDAQAAVAAQCYREATRTLGLLVEQLKGPQVLDARRQAAAQVLVEQSRRLLRDACLSMDLSPRVAQLRPALVALTEQVFAQGGPEVSVRQSGRQASLEPSVQVAVLRAVRRLLALLRHADVPVATLLAQTSESAATFTLRTKEFAGLSHRVDDVGLHAALREARAWIAPTGGNVEMASDPNGRCFVITAPTGVRRSERLAPARPAEESREVMPLQSARHPAS